MLCMRKEGVSIGRMLIIHPRKMVNLEKVSCTDVKGSENPNLNLLPPAEDDNGVPLPATQWPQGRNPQ